ncbi:endolytic transglycosylase MltG [Acetivibrio straminisolvens]|uniref:endolytic transglycosylase MltG n=1 Tax=Acetivibrio straminisolvens TaxID=253314 RepID=UPI001FB0918D|nr:endolytic transglycosylase MltG [Acetivibrio straminisolvens]
MDKEDFIEACNTEEFEYKFLKDIPDSPERKNRLEGYLFPDTYFFDPKGGERAIIEKFLDNFDAKFKPEFYERAKELNMTVDEVIILASIIERETALPEERAIVSSVFHNRLKSSNPELKKLQSCATVQYVLYNTQGKMKEKLSDEDTKINHPYNTYLFEGLPPGPICSPGLAAIEAALYPDEESEYLFFVAKGDGSHEFSKTLAEHLEAVKKYEAN